MAHKLNSSWVLWWHDLENKRYTLGDYEKIVEIATIEDFWIVFNAIPDFANGMFFLMRKGITPLWEDPINQQGGAWKFKVRKDDANVVWLNLAMTLVGETLSDQSEKITGISISPKYYNVTIRVWTREPNRYGHHFSQDIDPHIIFKNSIFELSKSMNDG